MDGNVLERAENKDYFVRVVQDETMCTATAVISVPAVLPQLPVIDASVVAVVSDGACGSVTDGTGSIDVSSATSTPSLTDTYSYTISTTPPITSTTGNFVDLLAGDYQIVAISQLTACSSLPLTVRVASTPNLIGVVESARTPNTTCGTLGNGSVSYDLSLGTPTTSVTYRHEIFNGLNTSTRISVVENTNNTHTFDNLTGGDYRIRVTDLSTECARTLDVNIIDTPIFPVFYRLTPSDVTHASACGGAPANGEITVSLEDADGNRILDPAAEGLFFSVVCRGRGYSTCFGRQFGTCTYGSFAGCIHGGGDGAQWLRDDHPYCA